MHWVSPLKNKIENQEKQSLKASYNVSTALFSQNQRKWLACDAYRNSFQLQSSLEQIINKMPTNPSHLFRFSKSTRSDHMALSFPEKCHSLPRCGQKMPSIEKRIPCLAKKHSSNWFETKNILNDIQNKYVLILIEALNKMLTKHLYAKQLCKKLRNTIQLLEKKCRQSESEFIFLKVVAKYEMNLNFVSILSIFLSFTAFRWSRECI